MCCTRMPRNDEQLIAYIIYRHPPSYPRQFVVRPWVAHSCGGHVGRIHAITEGIEEARAMIPAGLSKIQRNEDDDPSIFEGWI